jgi:bifunctional non-homologous end joining protein LigD
VGAFCHEARLKCDNALFAKGELCGVDEAGLPTFAHTQAATDGERNVQLVYYAFDVLHLDGWGVSGLQLTGGESWRTEL